MKAEVALAVLSAGVMAAGVANKAFPGKRIEHCRNTAKQKAPVSRYRDIGTSTLHNHRAKGNHDAGHTSRDEFHA